jgi:hypothetical protein
MLLRPAADLVALGAHHPSAELVKDAEGRLVAREGGNEEEAMNVKLLHGDRTSEAGCQTAPART